jgi:hypothetical protein
MAPEYPPASTVTRAFGQRVLKRKSTWQHPKTQFLDTVRKVTTGLKFNPNQVGWLKNPSLTKFLASQDLWMRKNKKNAGYEQ